MPQGSNKTVKQHYIPQVYLRGFSPQYSRDDKQIKDFSKYTIYCHDIDEKKQIRKAIPIKSICYKKELYEVTNSVGEIVLSNHLEKFLKKIEDKFGEHRHRLERKAFYEENYKSKCFLDAEEKVFWVTYIIIQMLRLPETLATAETLEKEMFEDKLTDQQRKNLARLSCLPFFKEIEEDSTDMFLFNLLFEPMRDMSFGVCVDKTGNIITSNKPVYICTKEYPCKEYERIIFPITSELCLFLFGGEDKRNLPSNFLFPINKEISEVIIKSMAESSLGDIYSNHILSKSERKLIKEAIKRKEEFA